MFLKADAICVMLHQCCQLITSLHLHNSNRFCLPYTYLSIYLSIRFPSDKTPRGKQRQKLWLSKMRRVNFVITNSSRLCSVHFEDDQFCTDYMVWPINLLEFNRLINCYNTGMSSSVRCQMLLWLICISNKDMLYISSKRSIRDDGDIKQPICL